ncbi:MAG: peptidoglycan-binding domain-containing protein [Terriglobales bacterium]
MALTLLTTGMLVQSFLRSAAGSDANKPEVPAFVIKNEIWKMQEILRAKGLYQGKVDGVFGLRTRASIRAYQKAENLTITGEVDTSTAAGLGVRPESSWDNSQGAGRPDGQSSYIVAAEFKGEKPSAGIRWPKGAPGKSARKEAARTTPLEDNRGTGAANQRAKNGVHDQ